MQGLEYAVDIVVCIDTTGSMGNCIDRVKNEAIRFHDDLSEVLHTKDKQIGGLRIRVVAFRDFYHDGALALQESRFFSLPEEKEEFSSFVRTLNADGGGDAPENGLEALALAIRSDWSTATAKRRHIIVMWTDTSAHELEMNAGLKPSHYPQSMPANFDDLTDLWEGQTMNRAAKRLILYAPDAYAWTDIGNHWENTVHFPSRAGEGLRDIDYRTIIDAIANSV